MVRNTIRLVLAMVCLAIGNVALASNEGNKADLQPKIRFVLPIAPSELTELHEVVSSFAKRDKFSINEFPTPLQREGRRIFLVDLIKENEIRVMLLNTDKEDRVMIFLYDLGSEDKFRQESTKFIEIIKKRWPALVPYKGLDIGPLKNL